MAQDHPQSLLLAQPSFPTHPQMDSQHLRPHNPILGSAEFNHQPSTAMSYFQPPRLFVPSSDTASDSKDVEYRVINYDELLQLFPEPKPSRIDVGLLPNGSAYAPVAREQYLLFPSKFNFILYFTHYYFSRENLSKDLTFLNKMTNGYMPLATLVQAPRLRAIQATQDEVAQALAHSKVVCVEDMGGGVRGVRRRDRCTGALPASDDSWQPCTSDGTFESSVNPVYPIMGSYHPVVIPALGSTFESSAELDKRPISLPSNDFAGNGKLVNAGLPANHCDQSFSSTPPDPVDTNSTPFVPDTFNRSLVNDVPSDSNAVTSVVTASDTSTLPVASRTGTSPWSSLQAGTPTSGSTFSTSSASQHSVVVEPGSLILNNPFPAPQNCSAGIPVGNLHMACELPFVPMRQPAPFGHCVLNSGGAYAFGGYPVTSTGSPVNFQIPNPSGHVVNGTFFTGASPQIAAFNSAAPTAALAAYAALAQQQSAYLQPSITHHLQTHCHPIQSNATSAAHPALPFYYANPSFHFPTQPTRQRFAQPPLYPGQAYSFQSPVLPNPPHIAPELIGHLNKAESSGLLTPSANAHNMANLYQVMLQPYVALHHAPAFPYNLSPADARVAMAATGLNIHRPVQPTRHPPTFGLGSIPVSCSILPNQVDSPICADEVNRKPEAIPVTRTTDNGMTSTDRDKVNCVTHSNSGTRDLSRVDVSSNELTDELIMSFTKNVSLGVAINNVSADAPNDKQAHHSSADSEDSTSSGIGEMNSACSSSAGDSRTLSSFTLTDQTVQSGASPPKTHRQKIRNDGGLRDVV